jgi:hypothetical protein
MCSPIGNCFESAVEPSVQVAVERWFEAIVWLAVLDADSGEVELEDVRALVVAGVWLPRRGFDDAA